MAKQFSTLLFCLINFYTISQVYFQERKKEGDYRNKTRIQFEGKRDFDYNLEENYTLILPKLSELKKALKTLDPSKKIKSEEIYAKNIKQGYSNCDFQPFTIDITPKTFSEIPPKDYSTTLFLDIHKGNLMTLWSTKENGETFPIASTFIGTLDFNDTKDITYAFNMLFENFKLMYINHKNGAFKKILTIVKNHDKLSEIPLKISTVSESQKSQKDFYRLKTKNFIHKSKNMTLLIPESQKSKDLDKSLTKWSYSKYKYVPQKTIDEYIEQNKIGYYFIKQQQVTGLLSNSQLSLVSTYKQSILYSLDRPAFKNPLSTSIPYFIKTFDLTKNYYNLDNTNSTITFSNNIEFTDHKLPDDLLTSRLVYVELRDDQHSFNDWINRSFKRRMKNYNGEYLITQSTDKINDSKYRIRLLSSHQLINFQKTTTTTYSNHSHTHTNTNTKITELFYLYIENIETKETYLFNSTPDFYSNLFKGLSQIK